MPEPAPYEIQKREFQIGDVSLPGFEVLLPTKDDELTEFHIYDDADDTRQALEQALSSWSVVWPKLEAHLLEGMTRTGQRIGGPGFSGYFEFDPDEDASEEEDYDYLIGFQLEEPEVPGWDAFIKGDEVVDFQPVY